MRRNRPERTRATVRGLTLIEIVVSMVVLAIITALVIYFAYPVRQAVDVALRAELTDVADNALQRISREVRLALPNSVRIRTLVTGEHYLEFLPVVTAGRYRAEGAGSSGGLACPDGDELAFGVPDTCFKSLGPLPNSGSITTNDFVVLNNYGAGFPNQDAYVTGTTNRRRISASAAEVAPDRQRLELAPVPVSLVDTFDAPLHDSPGKRFYVVSGNGTAPLPVTFYCTASGTLRRHSGYAMTAAQPAFVADEGQLLASRVAACAFEYSAGVVAPQVGLLTIRLTLSAPRSEGTETVSLYHSVHVVNIP